MYSVDVYFAQNFYGVTEQAIENFDYVLNHSSNEMTNIVVTYSYYEHAWTEGLPLTDVINATYASFLDLSDVDFKVASFFYLHVGTVAEAEANHAELPTKQF